MKAYIFPNGIEEGKMILKREGYSLKNFMKLYKADIFRYHPKRENNCINALNKLEKFNP